MYFLPPNTKVIENLIENYESGRITLYYGNSSSGKTTCCFLASLCAKDHKVVYVDTEKGFSSERIKQLYDGDINKLLENIFLIQPKSFKEQHETILKLKKLCENDKIKLIISADEINTCKNIEDFIHLIKEKNEKYIIK